MKLQLWLHPMALPNTPYATACSQHSHRQEVWWRFSVYCTSAATTGTRAAILALPDPVFSGGLSPETVWAAVKNGRAAMIDSVGNRSRESRFHITGSTNRLSNSYPPTNANMLGYSSACLCLYVLDTPIGLTNASIAITVLAQARLVLFNPITGFLQLQTPQTDLEPGTITKIPDWQWRSAWTANTGTTPFAPDEYMVDNSWSFKHLGDAWLAGGHYFNFWSPGRNPAPEQIRGVPRCGCVYKTDHTWPTKWQTNRSEDYTPRYFATFQEPISKAIYLVGFENYQHAVNQASGSTGLVPPDVELCIKYATNPFWKDFHTFTSGSLSNGVCLINFYEVFRTEQPWSFPIYASANEITTTRSLTSYTLTTTMSPMTLEPRYPFPPVTLAQGQTALTTPTTMNVQPCASTLPITPLLQQAFPSYLNPPFSNSSTIQQSSQRSSHCSPNTQPTIENNSDISPQIRQTNLASLSTHSISSFTDEWEEETEEEEQASSSPPLTQEWTCQCEGACSCPADRLNSMPLVDQITLLQAQLANLQLQVQAQDAALQSTDSCDSYVVLSDPQSGDSPLSTLPSGLPNWASLLKRALEAADPHHPPD